MIIKIYGYKNIYIISLTTIANVFDICCWVTSVRAWLDKPLRQSEISLNKLETHFLAFYIRFNFVIP